jgi:type I restriction enzyme, S subunit
MEGGIVSQEQKVSAASDLRRFKPYPAYKDSGIAWLGEVPAHWQVRHLKYFVRAPLAYGVLKPDKYAGDDGVRLIRILDVESGQVQEDSLEVISPEQSHEFRRTVVQPGDVIVSVVGTIGRAFVVPLSLQGANLSRALARIQLKQTLLPMFLENFLESHSFMSFVDLISKGTAQRVLNLGDLGNFSLAAPPEPEQCTIARFLDRKMAKIDALVAQKERLIELLQEKRTVLITCAVTKGLDQNAPMKDSGVEWLGEIPVHWEAKALKYYLRSPLAYGVLKPDKYEGDDGTPLIRILDVELGQVHEDQLEVISPGQSAEYRRTAVNAGDLIVSVVGTIGRCFIVPPSLVGANLSRALARVQLKPTLIARFLEYCLHANSFGSFVELVPSGTDQRVLNLGDLAAYVVGVPPADEQRAITAFLDRGTFEIDMLMAGVRSAIKRLKELRIALVSAAVTGKIDVREEGA